MTTSITSLSSSTDNNNDNNIKLCNICNVYKTINDFYKNSCAKDGLRPHCIKCFNEIRSVNGKVYTQRYNRYEPVQRPYCNICDCELLPKNFEKHLNGIRHKRKTKQLEKIKSKIIKLDPIQS